MADCSGEGESLTEVILPGDVTLDTLTNSDQTRVDPSEDETGNNIFGDIVRMEEASADLKDDTSIMAALAECGEDMEEDEDFENTDEEVENETDSDDNDDDDDDDEASEDGVSDCEAEPGKSTEEALEFGEMPDFSSMMEAEGSSVLQRTADGDSGLNVDQDSSILPAGANKIKSKPGVKGVAGQKAGKKRKRKSSVNEKDEKKAKRKKKGKRKKKSEKDASSDSKNLKASERRRNIRKIIGEKDLEKETLDAQQEELERQQRLMELKRQAMSSSMSSATTSKPSIISGSTINSSAAALSGVKEQDSQLKSLLQSAEEEADKQEKKVIEKLEKRKADIIPAADIKREVHVKEEKVDVIELSSDSEVEKGDDSDDCVMVQSSDEEEREQVVESEDLNDGGAHINDEQNCPDSEGRVLVNVGHPTDDPDIFLSPQMAKAIKPHQIGGVRFLYDNLVESLPRFNTSQGFGCILAHSMGLGKTIQVISFIDIFLRHTTAKKVLCIVPVNTLQNWMAEFNIWAPAKHKPEEKKISSPTKPKNSEKKPRERGKKNNKGSKAGPKGPKGQSTARENPTMNQMGRSEMDFMGSFSQDLIGASDHLGGQGLNSFGRPGMTEMGGIGGPGMGDAFQGPGMSQIGRPFLQNDDSGVSSLGSCNVGQITNMGNMGHMGQRNDTGISGMNVSHSGSSGGSFMEMPWMNSSLQPSPFANFSPPCGSSQQNAMGIGNPGSCMTPSTSLNQSAFNNSPVNPLRSENVNANSDMRFLVSPDNSLSSVRSSLTCMQQVNSSNNLSSTNSMNTLGNFMGMGNSISGDNSPASHSGMPFQNYPVNASGDGSLMSSSVGLSESARSNVFEDSSRGSPMSCMSMDSVVNNIRNENPDSNGLEKFMENNHGLTTNVGFGKSVGSSLLSNNCENMDSTFGNLMGNSVELGPAAPSTMLPADNQRIAAGLPSTNVRTSENVMNSDVPITYSSVETSVNSNTPPISALSSSLTPDHLTSSTSVSESIASVLESGVENRNDSINAKEKTETQENASNENRGKEWMSMDGIYREESDTKEIRYRNYKVFLLNDSCKSTAQRAKIIGEWNEAGGVLLIGYELYRLLSNRRSPVVKQKKSKAKKNKEQLDVIDVDEEDQNKVYLTDMHGALVNPGPELVICDEGHRIKNNHASISQALKQIRTRRRVVLTGYPLQNNLMEYWCMVDFVRPNFLGNKTEFSNMFERPIMNGQCQDSTAVDRKLMKQRAYVLHNLLEGFVQRRSHTVLQRSLPLKREYVFLIRMSPIQRKLYRRYVDSLEEAASLVQANSNPLKAFAVGCKIWNHPDILHKTVVLKKPVVEDNDLDIESSETSRGKKKLKKTESSLSLASVSSVASSAPNTPALSVNTDASSPFADVCNPVGSSRTPSDFGEDSVSRTGVTSAPGSDGFVGMATAETANGLSPFEVGRNTALLDKKEDANGWVGDAFKDYDPGLLEHGPKMVLLNTIIEESLNIGSKILVFSQSLSTLDTIEEFLSKQKVPRPETEENWSRNKSYFRLDGSTSSTERERLINEFNQRSNTLTWVFLVSTKAGCLGINLIGANRVVVLDASWNPCHDCQAVCRVFRFGQTKECFVYRLVTENTLERNIYDRQITKQGMADRVVDELNPDNHFSKRQMENLLKNEDKDFPYLDFSTCEDQYEDPVMINTLKKQGKWITKEPFSHESLLIDRKELRMSLREKRLAKEGYARDKRNSIPYSRPSYAAYYQGGTGAMPMYGRNPAHFSGIRPMVSTPAPRQHIIKPGVSVTQVITTTDILLPGTNTATSSGPDNTSKIAAGQKIIVIKTPKGVYIRTSDGKMFAVRSKLGEGDKKEEDREMGDTYSGGAGTSTTMTVSSGSTSSMNSPQPRDFFFKPPDGKLMERNLMDSKSISNYMYSQNASAMMRGDRRSQQSRYPVTNPVYSRSRPRPSMFDSAGSPGRYTNFTKEMMGLSRSRASPSWRGHNVLEGGARDGRLSEVSAQSDHGDVLSPKRNMDTSVNRTDTDSSQASFSKLPSTMGESPMMKLLMSEEESERVGSTAMERNAISGEKITDSYSHHQKHNTSPSVHQFSALAQGPETETMAALPSKNSLSSQSPLPWDMDGDDYSSHSSSDSEASLPFPYGASLASSPAVSPSEHFSQSPGNSMMSQSSFSSNNQQQFSPQDGQELTGIQESSDTRFLSQHGMPRLEDYSDLSQQSVGRQPLSKQVMHKQHLKSQQQPQTHSHAGQKSYVQHQQKSIAQQFLQSVGQAPSPLPSRPTQPSSSSPKPDVFQSRGNQRLPQTLQTFPFLEQHQQRQRSQLARQNKPVLSPHSESLESADMMSSTMDFSPSDYLQDQMGSSHPGTPSDHGSPSGAMKTFPSEFQRNVSFMLGQEGQPTPSPTPVHPRQQSQPFIYNSYQGNRFDMRDYVKQQERGNAGFRPDSRIHSMSSHQSEQEPLLNVGSGLVGDSHFSGVMPSSYSNTNMNQSLAMPMLSVPSPHTGSMNSPRNEGFGLGHDKNSGFSSPGMMDDMGRQSVGSFGVLFDGSPHHSHTHQQT